MRFKILVFVLTLAFLAGTFLAAYWFYDNVELPGRDAETQLHQRIEQAAREPAPDPSAASYQKAMEALEAGQLESAHEQLNRLIKVYPSSPHVPEVRRILGEINLDRLFSRSPMPGKRDYIVKSGDSLARIEKGSLTTIPFLKQLNNLQGLNIQPGERLVYQPLEFEVEINLSDSTLTLRQKAAAGLEPAFFKNYALTEVRLPPNFTRTGQILKTKIQEKIAWYDGGKLLPSDTKYSFARKRLVTAGPSGRPGLVLRPAVDLTDPAGEEKSSGQKKEAGEKGGEGKSRGEEASGAAAGSTEGAARPPVLFGLFLADSDMEELSTILRVGTPVVVRR
jgi:hypothetical protein